MTDPTSISFQEDGAPFSLQFNDIYFDTESGCQQSEQVFINGNNITERILDKTKPIVIGETGFGTGLNFFLTADKLLRAIDQLGSDNVASIHFISVEKYPLSKEQISKSLAMWPELKPIIEQTLVQYPDTPTNTPNKRCDIDLLDGKLKLTILFDDAAAAFSSLKLKPKALINAWYLDGFSPSQNADMWSDALFDQIARLSAVDASLATFTVAGFVRRHLTSRGFRVMKKATAGKKNQTLVAKFQQAPCGLGYRVRTAKPKAQHVTIIGGGIASACLTYQLAKQGVKVTLLCKDEAIAQGASSNAIGALYPLIHLKQDDISQFYVQALFRARQFYDQLLADGYDFAHQWCGLLELSFKDTLRERQEKFETSPVWPENVIHGLNPTQASELSGISLNDGGMFIPSAGWIAPVELVKALFKAAGDVGQVKIKHNVVVSELSQNEAGSWRLSTNKGELSASTLVVCGGADSNLLTPLNELPLSPVRGQVSQVSDAVFADKGNINDLKTVICHKGYMTPSHNNAFCIGATFDKNDRDINRRKKDDDFNIEMVKQALPDFDITPDDIVASKARLRGMTPDHLPMVGAVPKTDEYKAIYHRLEKDKNWKIDQLPPYYDNLYIMSGLGARGLCSAPLVADLLCAELCNQPLPMTSDMRFNLAPNRFVIKDIIKRKR